MEGVSSRQMVSCSQMSGSLDIFFLNSRARADNDDLCSLVSQ